ncbi:hypothetical protein GCM10010387_23100 [Streptomyces inusitatus]|uniref:Uncharacterized protein n=1 Tax=Streptomyces inusitatus TaxID=68221 RepID=A0A918Q1K1_9ACTN|nr:hypothetical protein GCM10010387_23100 [Streptomyces inusitatus]
MTSGNRVRARPRRVGERRGLARDLARDLARGPEQDRSRTGTGADAGADARRAQYRDFQTDMRGRQCAFPAGDGSTPFISRGGTAFGRLGTHTPSSLHQVKMGDFLSRSVTSRGDHVTTARHTCRSVPVVGIRRTTW